MSLVRVKEDSKWWEEANMETYHLVEVGREKVRLIRMATQLDQRPILRSSIWNSPSTTVGSRRIRWLGWSRRPDLTSFWGSCQISLRPKQLSPSHRCKPYSALKMLVRWSELYQSHRRIIRLGSSIWPNKRSFSRLRTSILIIASWWRSWLSIWTW